MFIKGLIALAFGTLSLGINEFVMMGVLPYVAQDYMISIATAGHAISAYALGVVCGSFGLLFMCRIKLKTILLILVSIQIAGSICIAVAPNFETLLIARFIAGLPHGCYFGAGAIVAQRIATQGKGNSAVSIMIAGMTVANVFGVPLGTALAHSLSWRMIFYVVACWSLLVFISIWRWLPDTGKIENNSFFGQFRFLKRTAPWLILAATVCGNGGIFCMISYISPLLTDYGSLDISMVSAVMMVLGLSMVAGNLISGQLCDRFHPGKVGMYCQGLALIGMLLIGFIGTYTAVEIVLMCLVAGCLFAIGVPQQIGILQTSIGGQLLGAGLVQAAFNLGNSLGAFFGGLPFEYSWNLSWVLFIGAAITSLGTASLWLYQKYCEAEFLPKPKTEQPDTAAQAAVPAVKAD